ncbi:MAG: hypothetical protein ACFFA2_01200 [Promethearchaeota archaeon]
MINQNLVDEFEIAEFGEINNKSLDDFKLSLEEFLFKEESLFNSVLIKGFELKGRNGNSLLLEFEKMLEILVNSIEY